MFDALSARNETSLQAVFENRFTLIFTVPILAISGEA
jgi:hypothetical protein